MFDDSTLDAREAMHACAASCPIEGGLPPLGIPRPYAFSLPSLPFGASRFPACSITRNIPLNSSLLCRGQRGLTCRVHRCNSLAEGCRLRWGTAPCARAGARGSPASCCQRRHRPTMTRRKRSRIPSPRWVVAPCNFRPRAFPLLGPCTPPVLTTSTAQFDI